jgi:hypothetical protein
MTISHDDLAPRPSAHIRNGAGTVLEGPPQGHILNIRGWRASVAATIVVAASFFAERFF